MHLCALFIHVGFRLTQCSPSFTLLIFIYLLETTKNDSLFIFFLTAQVLCSSSLTLYL